MNNRSYKIIWNKERQQYVVKSPSNAKTFARTALAAATVIGIMSSSVGVVSAATAITDTTSRTVSSNGSPVYVETKTTGNKEIEIGETATAEGVNNIAIGNGSQTTGNESVAIGGSTKAQGNQSTAVGYSSTAYGENSIALGMGAITGVKDQLGKVVNSSGDSGQYGENAVAIGAKANAQSTASVAIGANTVAISDTVSNFTSITKRPITVIGTDAIIDGGNKGSNGSTAIGGNSLAGLLYRVKGDTDTNFKDKVSFTEKDYDTASGGLIAIQGDTNPPDHSNNLFALAGIDTKKATIDVNEATAIGFDARALGDQSIAIGAQTVAGHSSVAIGGNDMNSVSSTAKNAYKDNVGKAFPTNSTSGFYPTTSALDGSVAIGQKAASYASLGTAIGTAAEVKSTATLGTAIGIGAQTGNGKEDNDAIGATAIGAGAYANARHATAIAIGSQALGVNSVATGYKSNASGVDSVAIGREAKASGTQSISIGTSNSVSGNYSGAVGDPSIIEGTGSYTVGNDNAVGATSTNVGAFGNNNQIGATATYDSNGKLQATAIYDSNGDLQRISGLVTKAAVDSSKVVGNNNYVNTSGTYVLGSGIGVKSDKSVMDTVANSVYLGDNSQVLATAGANMDVDGVAGSTTTGGATGSVSTATVKSKDAATTLTYGGFAGEKAVGAVSVGAAGSERRIQNVAAGEISATSTDAINGSQLYAANQVTANVAGSVADIIGGDTTVNPDGTLAVTNIGNTGKANVSDAIKAAKTTVTSDDNSVTVVSKPDTDGHTNYDLAVTKGSLAAGSNGTVTGAAADGVAGATTSNSFATVGDVANAINNSGFTLTTDKTGSGTNSAKDSELINPGDTVTMVAGNNLDVKQEDGTVTYALKEDITLNSVTTGDTTMTTDGIVIKNGAAGKPVSLTKDGLDNGGNTITNVADGTNDTDAVNVSQLNTKVAGARTTVTSADKTVAIEETVDEDDGHINYDLAVTKGSLTAGSNGTVTGAAAADVDGATPSNSFATVGDVANAINNSGFTLTTDKTGSGTNSAKDSELINPGDTVTMVAGNNLDVKQEDGTVTYALKEDITLNSVTTGDTTMTTDGIVIKNGAAGKPVSLTKDGLDNGGNTITNVAAGTAPTDAVNVSQLTTAVAGAKTTVTSDNKTVAVRETTKDDGHTNYDLAVTKGSLTAESNGTVTGTDSTDVDGATTSNSFATVGDVANAINNSGFTLKTNKTGTGTNSATGSELINPGDNVTMIAGNNLDVAQSNGTVTYALQNDITLNSVTTGNTVMNNTGLTIGSDSNTTVINAGGITINQGAKGNPVSLTNSGLDNGGNKIINVSPGEADTDAVNVSQLKQMGNNVDLAIADVKDDIADTGANAAALSALKPLQYDPLEPTQIMAGIGGYKGSHALAVGVAHFKNESTMFHAGVTMGNHNTMYNAGVTWKFGNRDEEEAVPDRYKAGPISSVYVMQDEVSAIKVQNQRLLAENKAQKDEIEQMKQMIQALVHKVGL